MDDSLGQQEAIVRAIVGGGNYIKLEMGDTK